MHSKTRPVKKKLANKKVFPCVKNLKIRKKNRKQGFLGTTVCKEIIFPFFMDFSDVARSSWQLVFVVSIHSLYYMSEFWLSCDGTTKNIKHILQQGTGELWLYFSSLSTPISSHGRIETQQHNK